MADPAKLYTTMKSAYERGNAQGWTFFNQEVYLSTIFDAGRAYSLQRPDDPAYKELEQLTVDIGSGVHYDPLINHDAVQWYVREAALYVERNNPDPAEVAKAKDLIARVDALEDPAALARFADIDATANAQQFPHDTNTTVQRVEANWRGWLITHDTSWRSLALARAAEPGFPLADIPTTWGPAFMQAVKDAASAANGYTPGDTVNAKAIEQHLALFPQLKTIGSVLARPSHDRLMTTLAPADEYFGPLGMSILGIRNELNRVNIMIGYGDAPQESNMAVQIAVAIDDLHKVYPRDRDLPQLLYDICSTLAKIDTPDAKGARLHMKSILTVEYQDTKQAQQILNS